jgi:hypothetical protein
MILNVAEKIIGHSLDHDFEVLEYDFLDYFERRRDISDYSKYLKYNGWKRSLKDLSSEFLNRSI